MIGVFDSGVGGLTVVRQLRKYLPDYDLIYFGDTARVPYGGRGEDTVKRYAVEDVDFLLARGAKIIIIACHTASAVAGKYLREKYPEAPIFDIVRPGLKRALAESRRKRIGVIGTRATIRSGTHAKLLRELDPKVKVCGQACPLLVPLVEEGWLKKPETRKILRQYLRPLRQKQVDVILLACTHYPMLKKMVEEITKNKVVVIDPAEDLAKEVKKYLAENKKMAAGLSRTGKDQFYASDVGEQFVKMSQIILGRPIKVRQS